MTRRSKHIEFLSSPAAHIYVIVLFLIVVVLIGFLSYWAYRDHQTLLHNRDLVIQLLHDHGISTK